jgi:tetratricopeptide (TPR) repeat protein
MKTDLCRVTMILAAAALGAAVPSASQDDTRALFEAGKYQAVVDQTAADAPAEAQYVRGLAQLKLDHNEEAKEAFRRLERIGDAWRSVGESAVALIDGDHDRAFEAAKAAVERDAGLAPAQYQLGLVLDTRGETEAAAEAFVKATEADPRMAYAHYHAGMNFYKAKRIDQMAVYFENFLKLAPDAPERPAVESIIRTIRGR